VNEQATIAAAKPAATPPIPFDTGLLDNLLDKAAIDALVVSSKHSDDRDHSFRSIATSVARMREGAVGCLC
jgi:hypothetical protein